MFSKKIAGVSVAAAVVGSALIPSVAFAEDTDPAATDAQKLQPAAVSIEKNVTDNTSIQNDNDTFTFTFTKTPCNYDGCITNADSIPAIADQTVTPGASGTGTVNNFMPAISDYGNNAQPGIYQWTVVEKLDGFTSNSPSTQDSEIVFSLAQYRVKAYLVKNAATNALEYNAVTIAKDKNDDGTDVDPAVKVEKMTFANIYETITDFKVTKNVVNNAGLPEDDNYKLEVAFTWPSNITSNPHIGVWKTFMGGNPPLSGQAIDETDCVVASSVTTCTVTINKDETLQFGNVPVGATWTVEETVSNGAKFSPSYEANGSGTVTDAAASNTVNSEKVTNTYDNITPTGIALAVLPYVLMIGIPLLAIAGYVALRRKMNL